MVTKSYAKLIRESRKFIGLTQAELAKKAGISLMSIRRYESGERTPTLEILKKIETALDVEWYDLKEDFFKKEESVAQEYITQVFSEDVEKHMKSAQDHILKTYPRISESGIDEALMGFRVGYLEAKGIVPPDSKALELLGFPKDVADIIMQVTELSDAGKEAFYSMLREKLKQEESNVQKDDP